MMNHDDDDDDIVVCLYLASDVELHFIPAKKGLLIGLEVHFFSSIALFTLSWSMILLLVLWYLSVFCF